MGNDQSQSNRRGYAPVKANANSQRTTSSTTQANPSSSLPPPSSSSSSSSRRPPRTPLDPRPHQSRSSTKQTSARLSPSRKPIESAAAANIRHQVVSAAEKRMAKSSLSEIAKKKREKNWKILFDDDPTKDLTSYQSESSLSKHLANDHSPTRTSSQIAANNDEDNHEDNMKRVINHAMMLLLDNETAVVKSTVVLLQGLCRNILKHASSADNKFRRLRLSNPHVQNSVVSVRGAMEVLEAIGFTHENLTGDDGVAEAYLFFSHERSLRNINIALEIGKSLFEDLH